MDWARRFDHMQQHTGQHVLSAAFDRVCQARTESFHLGAASATIDLHRRGDAGRDHRGRGPRPIASSGRIVPVEVRFVSAEEAAALPLRKETRPYRDAAPRRGDRLRPVGLRRHARRPHRRHRRRSPSPAGRSSKAAPGSSSSAAAGRSGGLREWRDALAATNRAAVGVAGRAGAGHRAAAGREQGAGPQRRAASRSSSPRTSRPSSSRRASASAVASWSRGPGRLGRRRPEGDRRRCRRASRGGGGDVLGDVAGAGRRSRGPPTSPSMPSAVLKALVARFGGKGGGKPDLAQGGGLRRRQTRSSPPPRTLLRGLARRRDRLEPLAPSR